MLLDIHDADVQRVAISMFLPQLADQSIPQLVQALGRQYLYYLVDAGALATVYTLQFNSTVNIEKFDKHYRAMCDVQTEIMVKKALLLSGSSATARAYQEHIVKPLENQLEGIKRAFKENLHLLSPMIPDSSRFIEFLNMYSKQHEIFKQASSIGTGAV